jgi:trehalose-phosphatase
MSAKPVTPEELGTEVLDAAARPWSVRTLVLDLEGALEPTVSAVSEEARAALGRLARAGWRVGIVSSRAATDARSRVNVEGVHVFGCHGAEGSWGGRDAGGPSLGVRKRLQMLEVEARRLTWYVTGSQVEVKPAGIAFHDREIADEDLVRWRELVEDLLSKHDLSGLERLEGERVLELRPQGQHKGRVLHRLPRAPRGAFDASLVVVGDDRRDRDLFETLGNRGLSVLVAPEEAPTRAVRRLAGRPEVIRFLELLAEGEEKRVATPTGPRTL